MIRRALFVSFLAVFACVGRANAMLVYERSASHAIVAARDDGSHATVLAHGSAPAVAPDGRHVIFLANTGRVYPDLRIVGVHGGRSRLLLRYAYVDTQNAAKGWSPNSRYVVTGNGASGAAILIDLAHKSNRLFPRDDSSYVDASFAPDSSLVAFADPGDRSPDKIVVRDIYGHRTRRVATGDSPVWGGGGLAYTAPAGIKRKTQLNQPAELLLSAGSSNYLYPVSWSKHGRRLLAARGPRQDQLQALLIAPATHDLMTLPQTFSEVDALSRNGKLILGVVGGNVVTVRADGTMRTLAHGAVNATWTR